MYASAYLKAHYPAAFYAALLNNQPMGFYHPATLVKDAQRHGVRFAPIDVQQSTGTARVEADGRSAWGSGLSLDCGRTCGSYRECSGRGRAWASVAVRPVPHAGPRAWSYLSEVWMRRFIDARAAATIPASATSVRTSGRQAPGTAVAPGPRPEAPGTGSVSSLDDLIRRTGVRRDELQTLAAIGALNAFGGDRRSALWQVERAARPAGELFA